MPRLQATGRHDASRLQACGRWILGLSASLLAATALGQEFAYKPIRLVSELAAGSGGDVFLRRLLPSFSAALGQPVIVENRGGANGAIGSTFVSRSAPDGYTILVGTSSSHVVVKYLSKIQPYDPLKDFTPITVAVSSPNVLVVPGNSKFKSVADIIADTVREFGETVARLAG